MAIWGQPIAFKKPAPKVKKEKPTEFFGQWHHDEKKESL